MTASAHNWLPNTLCSLEKKDKLSLLVTPNVFYRFAELIPLIIKLTTIAMEVNVSALCLCIPCKLSKPLLICIGCVSDCTSGIMQPDKRVQPEGC
jgi:hypothetical protein